MKRCFTYGRVSTGRQAEKGISLAAQDDIMYKKALSDGFLPQDITVVRDEGLTAGNVNRPGIQRIIAEIKNKRKGDSLEAVYIYNTKRISRNMIDLLTMVELARKKGVKIYNISSSYEMTNEDNEMLMQIEGMQAQKERKDGAKVIRFVLGYKKSEGQRYGNVPFGFKSFRKKLSVNPAEAPIVREIFELSEASGTRAVATVLNSKVPTRCGGKWHPSTISSILNNKEYYQKHGVI
jgi:DNA invertase Pin-like site-specific DNA recombinase